MIMKGGTIRYTYSHAEGFYCRIYNKNIYDVNGKFLCEKCIIRCKHSLNKKEGDYIVTNV